VMVGATSPVWAGDTSVPDPAIEVATHDGPGYAPLALASETEVVNTPVTGAAVAGDDGPWTKTVPAAANVAVNPGGRLPVPHSIAVKETATVVNPYPAALHHVPVLPMVSATLALVVKFQPVGDMNVTVCIAYALDEGLDTASVKAVGVS